MRLHLGFELLLSFAVQLYHGFRHGVSLTLKIREDLHHTAIEGTVNLFERVSGGKIDQKERGMPQEALRHTDTPGIGGRIASSNELDAVDLDPDVILFSPETPLLNKLPHEHDDSLSAVCIFLGEINLIAEHNEPALSAEAFDRLQHNVLSLADVGAVLVERLQNDLRCRPAREVETGENDALHVL